MALAAIDFDDEPVIGLRAGSDADDAECGKIMGLASAAGVTVSRLPFARGQITSLAPLARQGRRRIVAEEDGEVVGFIDFRLPSGHVRNIFVRPERQREGIGSLLLSAAEEQIGGIVTATVPAANEPGVRWYIDHGYKIIGGALEEDVHGGPAVELTLMKEQ